MLISSPLSEYRKWQYFKHARKEHIRKKGGKGKERNVRPYIPPINALLSLLPHPFSCMTR